MSDLSPASVLSGATFEIGLGMLEHLIAAEAVATAPSPALATMALTVLANALKKIALGGNGPSTGPSHMCPVMHCAPSFRGALRLPLPLV